MGQEKRLSKIGNIRALAIFLVVLGHSIILYSLGWGLYETSWEVPFLNGLKELINIVQMPLFFSLSGYLFMFTHRNKRGFFRLLKSKALRLLIPYLGIGLLFMLPIRLLVGFSSYRTASVGDFALKFLTANDVGHLWFLPALFAIFLLSEVILLVAEKLPYVKKYPEVFLCIAALTLYLEGYRISFGYPPIQSAYTYLLWFSFGYLLNSWQEVVCRVYRFSLVKWGLLFLNAGMLAYCLYAGHAGLIVSLATTAVCILNAYGAMPQQTCSLVEKVDKNSFGVYLFHSPLIYVTFATIPNAHPALVVFINLVCLGALAFGLTELVRKTKLKLLIGE